VKVLPGAQNDSHGLEPPECLASTKNDNFGQWRSDLKAIVKWCGRAGSRGRSLVDLLLPGKDDYFILKPKHSAFYQTPLELLLKHFGTERLIQHRFQHAVTRADLASRDLASAFHQKENSAHGDDSPRNGPIRYMMFCIFRCLDRADIYDLLPGRESECAPNYDGQAYYDKNDSRHFHELFLHIFPPPQAKTSAQQ
jgi:hypothetical protein